MFQSFSFKKNKNKEPPKKIKKITYSSLVKEISAYVINPISCPEKLLIDLLDMLNIKSTFRKIHGLQAVGGEAIVIAVQDNIGRDSILKISTGYVAKFGTDKIKVVARFVRGCKIQHLIYKELLSLDNSFFRVPEIYAVSEKPLYCVMEWVNGARAVDYLKTEKNIYKRIDFFLILLSFVEFCYSRGAIIHRDLKAANIMIGTFPGKSYGKLLIYVIDWGYAKVEGNGSLTLEMEGIGSPAHASPRQLVNEDMKNCTIVDEIYSLGLTFWEFVTATYAPEIRSLKKLESKNYMDGYNRELAKKLPQFARIPFLKSRNWEAKDRPQSIIAFRRLITNVIQDMKILVAEKKKKQREIVEVHKGLTSEDKSVNTTIYTDLRTEEEAKENVKKEGDDSIKKEIETSKYGSVLRDFLKLISDMK